jgi:dTDP-glucose pyrophosphorylase
VAGHPTARALVLARGLGTRMQRPDGDAALTDAQRRAADAGLKPLMPIAGRPFLDYVLTSLADAGLRRVGLVVAPDHDAIAAYYASHPPARVALDFIVQPEPLGTADAVRAAEPWTEGRPFLVMNGDNLYPVRALADLASLDEPGLPAFDADDLVRSSNIPAERIRAFALIEIDADGYLSAIVEKPADSIPPATDTIPPGTDSIPPGTDSIPRGTDSIPPRTDSIPPKGGSYTTTPVVSAFRRNDDDAVASAFRRNSAKVSMNCWRFDARIFDACRDVPRSARGEYELPEAVGLAVRRGVRFRAIPATGPVLDLSRRADASDVERRLAGVEPRP